MDLSHGASQLAANKAEPPVQLAKGALRRMALAKVEPTPENYARAYAAEAGRTATVLPDAARLRLQRLAAGLANEGSNVGDELVLALMAGRWDEADAVLAKAERKRAQTPDWAPLLQRLITGLERGNRQWTVARRKDGLTRLLGQRGDARLLRERLARLLDAWDGDGGAEASDDGAADALLPDAPSDDSSAAAASPVADAAAASAVVNPVVSPDAGRDQAGDGAIGPHWTALVQDLEATVRAALPTGDAQADELARSLQRLSGQVADAGSNDPALVAEAAQLCQRAREVIVSRARLLDELGRLCAELTDGLTELAEDDSWARGQCELMRSRLAEGLNVRSVRAAGEVLANARKQQVALRDQRNQARDALKELIHGMLSEIGQFGEHTGRFEASVGRHAAAIAQADSLGSLADVVRQMLDDSSEVQALVRQTQGRLQTEHERAGRMQLRVRELEDELVRLSDEVATDALTQVANRRGLATAFDTERARLQRARTEGSPASLAVGLIDIDNFKRLNDTLGHAAGDVALQKLAAMVRDRLRPLDTVARFGGEEFVVMLPDTEPVEAQTVLTRLQRQLTASLFMHENKEVFVTFSAGVTALREAEPLESALERADSALYEAKRSGKNRTCIG